MFRSIITLLSLSCLCLSAQADEITLQKNHPERYVVKKGDTLWGISGTFLKDPWLWPKVWKMNRAEIKNPHLIYPGDVVVLDMSSGSPEFKLLRQTVTLEPGVIEEPLAKEAIYTIPPNVIGPFLSQPLLIEQGELENAPRIVGVQDNRLILSPGTRVYINNLEENDKTFWNIYRPGTVLKDPDTNEILGTEAIYLGDAKITKFGQPSSGNIVKAKEEIFTKDRLVVASEGFKESFVPHAPETDLRGRILKIYGGVAEAGPETVVSVNLGKQNGLEDGHVLAISRHGKVIRDPEYKRDKTKAVDNDSKLKPDQIQLPDERIGLLMIFRTFDRVSYGLIMQTSDAIYTLDNVHTP
jgi:hypothetical protein